MSLLALLLNCLFRKCTLISNSTFGKAIWDTEKSDHTEILRFAGGYRTESIRKLKDSDYSWRKTKKTLTFLASKLRWLPTVIPTNSESEILRVEIICYSWRSGFRHWTSPRALSVLSAAELLGISIGHCFPMEKTQHYLGCYTLATWISCSACLNVQ